MTLVPDLNFVLEADGQQWDASYNALRGSVSGRLQESTETPLTWRRFLTKMHTAKGYPMSSASTKWFWAIGVDVMAAVMIYWGVSGLLMWWQIKSTRIWGLVVLLLSFATATVLAIGMYGMLSAA